MHKYIYTQIYEYIYIYINMYIYIYTYMYILHTHNVMFMFPLHKMSLCSRPKQHITSNDEQMGVVASPFYDRLIYWELYIVHGVCGLVLIYIYIQIYTACQRYVYNIHMFREFHIFYYLYAQSEFAIILSAVSFAVFEFSRAWRS